MTCNQFLRQSMRLKPAIASTSNQAMQLIQSHTNAEHPQPPELAYLHAGDSLFSPSLNEMMHQQRVDPQQQSYCHVQHKNRVEHDLVVERGRETALTRQELYSNWRSLDSLTMKSQPRE